MRKGIKRGLALTLHRRSLIMRRQYTDLGALIERFATTSALPSEADIRASTQEKAPPERG